MPNDTFKYHGDTLLYRPAPKLNVCPKTTGSCQIRENNVKEKRYLIVSFLLYFAKCSCLQVYSTEMRPPAV